MRCLAPLVVLLVAGCQTIMIDPPPSVEGGVARAKTDGSCNSAAYVSVTREGIASLPQILQRCAPAYPTELQIAGVAGVCATLLDLQDDGVPQVIESRCNVEGGYGPHQGAWTTYAQTVLAAGTSHAVARYRFSPADRSMPDQPRKKLVVSSVYALNGARPSVPLPLFEGATDLSSRPFVQGPFAISPQPQTQEKK